MTLLARFFKSYNEKEIFTDAIAKIENVSIKKTLVLIQYGYWDEISDFEMWMIRIPKGDSG